MKTIALITAVLITATNVAYAGHSKIEDTEQEKDANEVTISKSTRSENASQVTTNKKDDATPGSDIDLNNQYYEIYKAYRDLDRDLGS